MNRRHIINLTALAGLGLAMLLGSAFAQQVLKVGYAPFAKPNNFLPGATVSNYQTLDPKGVMAQGAVVDLIKAIAKDAGFQVQFIPVLAGAQAPALTTKKIDLTTTGGGITEKYTSAMEFSQPIYRNSDVLFVTKNDTKQYKTYEDLRGEVIGTQKGTALADALQKSGLFTEVKVYASGQELRQAVTDGLVKAGFDPNLLSVTYLLQHGQWPDLQIVNSYQPKFLQTTAIGAREDEGDVLKKINASIIKLKGDGRAKAIFAEYGIEEALVN